MSGDNLGFRQHIHMPSSNTPVDFMNLHMQAGVFDKNTSLKTPSQGILVSQKLKSKLLSLLSLLSVGSNKSE